MKRFTISRRSFYHHTVERIYYAVARGAMKPPQGKIETKLAERSIDGVVYATKQEGRGQPASTIYETLRTQGKRSLLKVTLETGRKHQIRVHLASRGCPIVGDTVYGPKEAKDAAGARFDVDGGEARIRTAAHRRAAGVRAAAAGGFLKR